MSNDFFKPISGFELPRFAGLSTFLRLPNVNLNEDKLKEIDIGLIGAPWDGGTTNRPGPRHGPRQVRDMSTMIRHQHGVSGIRPFDKLNCADLGDVAPNPASLEDTLERFEKFYSLIKDHNIIPITIGGDHLCSLPILRVLAKSNPIGLVQFDSHTDLYYSYFNGQKYTHGTPFRRAIEEGLLDSKRMVQIGIRGTDYDSEHKDFAKSEGIRIISIEEFFARGIKDVMEEVLEIVGNKDTYLSYDIDFVDPAFAPGTGTPEVGGPNSFQALEVVRKLSGIKIVGADLMEVSPPFDSFGNTAFLAASIIFEQICLISEDI